MVDARRRGDGHGRQISAARVVSLVISNAHAPFPLQERRVCRGLVLVLLTAFQEAGKMALPRGDSHLFGMFG